MKRISWQQLHLLISIAFFIVMLHSFPYSAENNVKADEVISSTPIILTTEYASVFTEGVTTLGVKAILASTERLEYKWSVTAGLVLGQGPEVQWSFVSVKPGLYTATVEVQDRKSNKRELSVRVAVRQRPPERGRETGWHLLVKDKREEQGYGLYSYVLFGSDPNAPQVKEKALKSVDAYLALMPRIVGLERYLPRKELNIAYLPVRSKNPEDEDDPKERLSAHWVLNHYDLERARAILSKLEGNYRDGPYILSFLSPPLDSATAGHPYLVLDLSRVPLDLIRAWMKEFLNQAAQERFWEKRQMPRFVLNLRTGIEIVSVALPDAKRAVNEWITLAK